MTTERIEINQSVMMGKPVIRGTRITVEPLLRKLAEGGSEQELLEDYPFLTIEDVRAAIAYGAAGVAHEEVVLLPDKPVPAKPQDVKFPANESRARSVIPELESLKGDAYGHYSGG